MKKILLAIDPRELWKFTLDEDGYRTEIKVIESEGRYLTELQEKQLAIIGHYGLQNQLDRLIEECGELVQAICKYKRHYETTRGPMKIGPMIEEMADVKNLIEQLELESDYIREVMSTIKEYKINRELGRIDKE